jgi:hypothetical protein
MVRSKQATSWAERGWSEDIDISFFSSITTKRSFSLLIRHMLLRPQGDVLFEFPGKY